MPCSQLTEPQPAQFFDQSLARNAHVCVHAAVLRMQGELDVQVLESADATARYHVFLRPTIRQTSCSKQSCTSLTIADVQKKMKEFEQALQAHLTPLTVAQGANTCKVIVAHERDAQARHDELVGGAVCTYKQVAGPRTLQERFNEVDNQALEVHEAHTKQLDEARKHLSDQIERGRAENHAHWQDLVSRSEAQLAHITSVGVGVVEVQDSVQGGRRENVAHFERLHDELKHNPSKVAAEVVAVLVARPELLAVQQPPPQVGSV